MHEGQFRREIKTTKLSLVGPASTWSAAQES